MYVNENYETVEKKSFMVKKNVMEHKINSNNTILTILVDESKTQKLEIDLARENCKLVIGGENYEELILKEICSKCLQNLEQYHNILQELSWLYYIDENNQIKKVIKNDVWILEHAEMKYLLVYVDYENYEEFFEEKLSEVIKKVVNNFGKNIVIEIVKDCLRINTTFNDKEYNDLYIAARYQLQLIITNQEYNIIEEIS